MALNKLNPKIIERRKSSLKKKGIDSPSKSVQFNIINTSMIESVKNTEIITPLQHVQHVAKSQRRYAQRLVLSVYFFWSYMSKITFLSYNFIM
jgi:hypothetical protein